MVEEVELEADVGPAVLVASRLLGYYLMILGICQIYYGRPNIDMIS